MKYSLLWGIGPDHSGIVAAIAEILLGHRCNLEDSSMLRIGSEFGIFLIFSGNRTPDAKILASVEKKYKLSMGIKPIDRREALFKPVRHGAWIVKVYGPDRPGIVYHVTSALAQCRFNITDLMTHRTTGGGQAGYILMIEGEMAANSLLPALRRKLMSLQKKLKSTISLDPIQARSF
jgi:glycine cleavage system regulatory protein